MQQDIPGWRHVSSGKVRDLYVPVYGADDVLLLVASDRVSAFDVILEPEIPGKGATLTALSSWWFDRLDGGSRPIPNHRTIPNHHTGLEPPPEVADRAVVVQALDIIPIECVVRGYLAGSGWAEYVEHGTVCGIALPEGLAIGEKLPEPIFTPARKAPQGEHDENISFTEAEALVGADVAAHLRDVSLEIYSRASAIAAERGLILADTKFEFGRDRQGVFRLADEVLTSDSSRYWDANASEPMTSFDKQIVRDWLEGAWNKTGTPPRLPDEIVGRTADRYRELLDRLTGSA